MSRVSRMLLFVLLVVAVSGAALPSHAQRNQEPVPVQFSGVGDILTPKAVLLEGLCVINLLHFGRGDFNVRLLNDNGEVTHELISWHGRFNGSRALGITGNGLYRLEIEASGSWRATINQPRPDYAFPVTYLSGSTTQATHIFGLTPGEHLFRIEYAGDDWFNVNLLDNEGYFVATLAETKGGNRKDYTAEFTVETPYGGVFILDVQADDRWEIWVE